MVGDDLLTRKASSINTYEMWVSNQTVIIWEKRETGQGSGIDLSSCRAGTRRMHHSLKNDLCLSEQAISRVLSQDTRHQ